MSRTSVAIYALMTGVMITSALGNLRQLMVFAAAVAAHRAVMDWARKAGLRR